MKTKHIFNLLITLILFIMLSISCGSSKEDVLDSDVTGTEQSNVSDDSITGDQTSETKEPTDEKAIFTSEEVETIEENSALFRVLLTDKPIDHADNVWVTFSGITIKHQEVEGEEEGGESEEVGEEGDEVEGEDEEEEADEEVGTDGLVISEEEQTVDLLALQGGVLENIGQAEVPAGSYGQVRLMLVNASIVIDGTESELTIPSGDKSGLKIPLGITLEEGDTLSLVLDFDAAKSVNCKGQMVDSDCPGGFQMKPVIKVVHQYQNGEDEIEEEEAEEVEAEEVETEEVEAEEVEVEEVEAEEVEVEEVEEEEEPEEEEVEVEKEEVEEEESE